jgi:hypothetical protein
MFKDVQLGIHIANSLDIDLPATTSTAGVMYGGLTKGWADDDFSVLARAYQKEDAPAQPLAVTGPALPRENVAKESAPVLAVPEVEKKMEAPRELTADELRNVGVMVPEPEEKPVVLEKAAAVEKVVEPVKAEAAKPEAGNNNAPAEGTEEGRANAEAARPHTPFVRIRRWFGTGTPN